MERTVKQRGAKQLIRRVWTLRFHLLQIGLIGVLLGVSGCGLLATVTYSHSSTTLAADILITSPIRSSGCGKPPPFAPGLSENEIISSGGYERMYRLHLPSGYHDSAVQALVLNFHGHDSTAALQEKLTKLSLLADSQDFIAAYPQGTIGADSRTGWATGPVRYPHVNDVLFVSDLLNRLQAQLCIDPLRIYALGFSNGGGMTNLLAARMAGRIAAFASVSGSYYPVAAGYHPVRPVPFLEIHGTADHVVPYDGSPAKDYAPVTSWLLAWAQRDHCTSRPDTFLKLRTMIGIQWVGCQAGATIVHYRVMHEGHIWPHVLFPEHIQKQTRYVPVTALIWQFFQDHPMANRQARNDVMTQPATRKRG
jgi:polyhydroxybutyrate depolymerase